MSESSTPSRITIALLTAGLLLVGGMGRSSAQTAAAPASAAVDERLGRFAPFIGGTWVAEGEVPGAGRYTAERNYTPVLDGAFIRVHQTMAFESGPTIEEDVMMGWDPIDQRIHIWSYASDGSYSDGYEVPGEDPRRWTAEGRTVGGRGGDWRITTFLYDPDAFSLLIEVRTGHDYEPALTLPFHRRR